MNIVEWRCNSIRVSTNSLLAEGLAVMMVRFQIYFMKGIQISCQELKWSVVSND